MRDPAGSVERTPGRNFTVKSMNPTLLRTSDELSIPMKHRTGFTLVEILIVVVILAIIAAVALPRFSNASAMARASMLADDLRILRMQLEVYRGQHNGIPPGYPDGNRADAPTVEALVAQLTSTTNQIGQVGAAGTPGFRYGPYLREMPVNPLNNKTTVQLLADGENMPAEGDDSHGWLYKPATMEVRADSPGEDDVGRKYAGY